MSSVLVLKALVCWWEPGRGDPAQAWAHWGHADAKEFHDTASASPLYSQLRFESKVPQNIW